MLLLPSPASPAYNVITAIEGVDYELVYTYDEHRNLWRFGVNSRSGDAIMGDRPLLPYLPMRPNAFASALEGVFALIAPLPTGDAYEDLTGGLWSVVYGTPEEIAWLEESLDDLAGDVEYPVVPIEVLYPPNNAELSSPVVTFNGTGPADQLLFVRGESVQIDSMGNWVWTHTFSDTSPVVVFQGESGQSATVRFSIVTLPLIINPVGEDIDGSMYAFTELVHVSGSASPDSTITVNGQPVVVGSDGLWSVELTLPAGQSHTITAQSADGQVVQTDVYVWGEPDVDALLPRVYLKRGEHRYVDAAQTMPATDGDLMGAWVDPVRGIAFTQDDSALRPVAYEGGFQLVNGDGNKRLTADGLAFPPDASVYAMVRMTGGGFSPSFGCGTRTPAAGWSFGRQAGRIMTSMYHTSLGSLMTPTPDPTSLSQFSETEPDLVRFTLQEQGNATGYLVRTGYEGSYARLGAPTTTFPNMMIGCFSTSEFGQEIFELLAFDRILSASDDTLLMKWLGLRYDQLTYDLAHIPEPFEWDGEYENLPNLVAGWLPDRGLYKNTSGTVPAGESDPVLGWRDFVQETLLPYSEGDVAFVIGGVATLVPSNEPLTQSLYGGEVTPPAESIVEAVVGSAPREGGVEPVSYAMMVDDADEPSLVLMVAADEDEGWVSLMGDVGSNASIVLPEPPSCPVSLRLVGSNAELANLNGALGEQVGDAEPIVGMSAMIVYTAIEGADNIPLSPFLLFSEPLDAETRTQLFNKLKDDFPAWSWPEIGA